MTRKRATRAESRQKPTDFTARYHANEALQLCPDCGEAADLERPRPPGEKTYCSTCDGIGLVYAYKSKKT